MESKITVYSANLCGHCKKLKEFLQSNNIRFEEKNIGTAESLTELRVNGCFTIGDPVLRIGDQFFTDKLLFVDDVVQENVAEMICSYME